MKISCGRLGPVWRVGHAGLADGAVVVLRPSSRWQDLDRSVERVRRAARTSLRLWFERKPLEPGARAASSRVEPAPVRASS